MVYNNRSNPKRSLVTVTSSTGFSLGSNFLLFLCGGFGWGFLLFFFLLLSGFSLSGSLLGVLQVLSLLFQVDCLLHIENFFNRSIDILKVVSKHFICFSINFDSIDLDLRLFRSPVQSSLSFFLLHFEGNTLDWSFLDSLHQMSSEPCNLIPQLLGGYLSDF